MVKNVENLDFDGNFREISNLVKIFEQSRFWSKLSKILFFGQNLPKCRFWSKLKEILILIQLSKNVDLGQNLPNCQFWTKLKKMLFLVNFFKKTPIFLKISENLNFVKIIKKCWFGNIDFGEIVEKSEIWSKLSEKLHFGKNCRKFSILVKTYQNVEFGQNQR